MYASSRTPLGTVGNSMDGLLCRFNTYHRTVTSFGRLRPRTELLHGNLKLETFSGFCCLGRYTSSYILNH